jgi:phage gp29-like protein
MATKKSARMRPKSAKFVPPVVRVPARDRWLDKITRTVLPADVKASLEGAIMGNLENQTHLFWQMMDTWPRLASNVGDMQEAIAGVGVRVKPFVRDAESEPTSSALEKARFVQDALDGMRADPITNEVGLDGLVRHIVWGCYASPQGDEIYWGMEPGPVPVATKAVPPRFYGYATVGDSLADELRFFPDGHLRSAGEEFDRDKFVVAQRLSYPGHPSLAAPLRALTPYWLASKYGVEWFMSYAQLFGVPFRWATVSNPDDVQEVGDMLDAMGSAGWGAFPMGTEMHIDHAGASAQNIPQGVLIELADKKCDIYIRGETLTSDEGTSGSRSLGEVHERGYLKRKQAVAAFTTVTLTEQVGRPICRLNYGDDSECPTLCVTVPTPADDLESAQRVSILVNEVGLPMKKKWVYDSLDVDPPEDGDELYKPPEKPEPQPVAMPDPNNLPTPKPAPVAAARSQERLDALVDNTLGSITGLPRKYTAGVRPFFERLLAKAQRASLSDEDFAEALRAAQRQLPDLFDRVDSSGLRTALEEAQNSAVVAGALDRLEQE